MRSLFALLSLTVLLAAMSGCRHEPFLAGPVDPVDTTGNGGGPIDTTVVDPGAACDPNIVYFQRDVLPILISNCTMGGCHDAASAQDGVVLTDFQNVVRTADVRPYDLKGSDLYEVITEDDEDDRMPKDRPPLPEAQIAVIRKWIEQGAKNLTCTDGGTGGCQTANVSYSRDLAPLFQNNCIGCHSGPAPSGGYNFTTYQGVANAATAGRLYGAVAHLPGYQPMPLGGAQLSACNVQKIKAWVDGGAENN